MLGGIDVLKTLVVVTAFSPLAAVAQTFPSRQIVMVVPYAAGGTFDVMGRILAPRMSELLGQPVIVENTTGAGGIVGVNRVINSPPDGYTLLLGSTGTHAYNQTIYKKRRYDASPISRQLRCSRISRWCSKRARIYRLIQFPSLSRY